MAFLRSLFGVVGLFGNHMGYQTVNSVGDAVGSHDGIVASSMRWPERDESIVGVERFDRKRDCLLRRSSMC